MKGIFPLSISGGVWLLIGCLRSAQERFKPTMFYDNKAAGEVSDSATLAIHKVAICVPAHNEETVITKSIVSLKALVPADHIFVAVDGSNDATATIAHRLGCNVLELVHNYGKPRALETVMQHFQILDRFDYVLIADADTTFSPWYLYYALPLFRNKNVAAVAGYVRTAWNPTQQSWRSHFFLAYRLRFYRVIQWFYTYGQTWHATNVMPVIPGFASIYRSDILKQVDIYAPGVIIEDFNLAFQIQKNKLGSIAHDPRAYAETQDPNNFQDYVTQMERWNMGLWQTIRYWGVWPSLFWANLAFCLAEVLFYSLYLLALPLVIVAVSMNLAQEQLWTSSAVPPAVEATGHFLLITYLGLFVFDYGLTLLVALIDRRYALAWYGLGFFFLKIVDAQTMLIATWKAFTTTSNGRWVSPRRYVAPTPIT